MGWKVADAKNKLSEVITLALNEEPQKITRRGESVIVISEKEYESMKARKPSLIEFIMNGPSFEGMEIGFDRKQETMRDIEW